MNVWDFLNSINSNKKNLFDESESPDALQRIYSPFVVSRALSYSADCILYVNELNIRGLKEFNIQPRQHYEFLLGTIPKGKRYNKWSKPEKNELVELVMSEYNYSFQKAVEVIPLLSEEDKQELLEKQYGGVVK